MNNHTPGGDIRNFRFADPEPARASRACVRKIKPVDNS
jgi:hypothetical protein